MILNGQNLFSGLSKQLLKLQNKAAILALSSAKSISEKTLAVMTLAILAAAFNLNKIMLSKGEVNIFLSNSPFLSNSLRIAFLKKCFTDIDCFSLFSKI